MSQSTASRFLSGASQPALLELDRKLAWIGEQAAPANDVLPRPAGIRRIPAEGQSLSVQGKALQGDLSSYKDKWIAIRDGQIVDSDKSYSALERRMKEQGLLEDSLFIQV